MGGLFFDFEPFRTESGPSSRERPSYNAGGRCIAEKPPVGLGWDKAEIKPARVQSAISSLKNAFRNKIVRKDCDWSITKSNLLTSNVFLRFAS